MALLSHRGLGAYLPCAGTERASASRRGRAGAPSSNATRPSLPPRSTGGLFPQTRRSYRQGIVVKVPNRGEAMLRRAGTDQPSAGEEVATISVPRGPEETAQQALAASIRAREAGVTRQRMELLLPLIGATDLDDWPGGIQQQFKAVLPMVEAVLKGLKQEKGLEGPLDAAIIDQGDAVGQWKGDNLAAVVFPTGQTLKNVKSLAENASRLVLMVNPQWQGGQIINDFGVGPWRKASEDFVASFEEVYHLSQKRIQGDECRLLRSYPGKWQVHMVDASGDLPCVGVEDEKPSYERLSEILSSVPGSKASQTWDERLRSEMKFVNDSLKPPQ